MRSERRSGLPGRRISPIGRGARQTVGVIRHLGHPYYVCRLSAAEVHGYAHQRPQVFQVMTTARLRDRAFGRVRIEFSTSRHTAERPAVEVNTPTGSMRVSTRETTVLDLVARPDESGALSNVATIIGEMLDDGVLDIDRLVTVPRAIRLRSPNAPAGCSTCSQSHDPASGDHPVGGSGARRTAAAAARATWAHRCARSTACVATPGATSSGSYSAFVLSGSSRRSSFSTFAPSGPA